MERLATRPMATMVLAAGIAAFPSAAQHRSSVVGEGQRYVAMGSSYAAGPAIDPPVADAPHRCGRSAQNYAHQIARQRRLTLVDVSCSGATTAHILDRWNELPAQIDSVTPDTRLVTVTIGGNDVGYVSNLMAASCHQPAPGAAMMPCPAPKPADPGDWSALDVSLHRIAAEVRRRAPRARLVFVGYPTVLPDRGVCAAAPLAPAGEAEARSTATRLEALTARVARESGADWIPASSLTHGHDVCATDAWMNGVAGSPGDGAPFHPTRQGMAVVADAVIRIMSH